MLSKSQVMWFDNIGRNDVSSVGGKNASLGEMVVNLAREGIRVPPGFATTADAFWRFVDANQLRPLLQDTYAGLAADRLTLKQAGETLRSAILNGHWPPDMAEEIAAAYRELGERAHNPGGDVAVRSSATAEDLPDASFAGQQESFLNIRGEADLLDACKRCYASLFTDRAITYRTIKGFDHMKVALSIGVQQMVRSDLGGSGVMFSIDTETGFDKVVLINAAWGLGENVVQGTVEPDEYLVFKPFLTFPALKPILDRRLGEKLKKLVYSDQGSATINIETSSKERATYVLNDAEVLQLARWAVKIEEHYGRPMDIEWARDGRTGALFILQARPETVQSRRSGSVFRDYHIKSKGRLLAKGLAIGEAVVNGKVCLIDDPQHMDRFVDGSILVASNTDPDWVPLMKRASAIVTDHGGRTSHAAIVSRELGVPAIVGTSNATVLLSNGQSVTVSCAEGAEGSVYEGFADFTADDIRIDEIPRTHTKVMLNLADPSAAFRWWRIPADGVGLARMEFVIANQIRVHPLALLRFDELRDAAAKETIAALTRGYPDKREYFVDRLALGLARIAASQYPRPVIVRMSDFKTNEYANLIGGAQFEPKEENPMIGFRGASRYYSSLYRDGFALECQAIRRLREEIGFDNVVVMIPFCRTPKEAREVLEVMAQNGLHRGGLGLNVFVMCEIPSNVILAKEFARYFDGFSIGSNDLTQLTLGVDRDSAELAPLFDENDPSVKWMIQTVIKEAHAAGAKVGLCGQAPSDDPAFAEFLVASGIDSVSVTPDSFARVKRHVGIAEARAETAA